MICTQTATVAPTLDAGGRGGDGDGPSRAGLGGSGVASAGGGGAIAAHWGAARSAE